MTARGGSDQPADEAWAWTRETITAIAGAVTLAAVVVFGALTVAYDKFYGELGLSPGDVGLQYGKTLGGTAATAIIAVTVVSALTATAIFLLEWHRVIRLKRWIWARPGRRLTGTGVLLVLVMIGVGAVAFATRLPGPAVMVSIVALAVFLVHPAVEWERHSQRNTLAGVVACLVTVAALFNGLEEVANYYAGQVKNGRWVEAPEFAGFNLFVVRAMPVTVEPITTTAGSGLDLRPGNYFYLGQANSMVVLYEQSRQAAVMLPATQVRLTVLNCETRQARDPRCR
ncbi:MAG TPA: hypothetical protein VFU43_26170 [Streptosporangiaceae bacterium]|nr:hypothetical protein [Streptosporangiaceae bacterium]